jgi:LysR family glycine cleavage system transcriptional activator
MARSLLVEDYLRRGELVRLFDLSVPGVFSYYLAWRSKGTKEHFAASANWIIQAIKFGTA